MARYFSSLHRDALVRAPDKKSEAARLLSVAQRFCPDVVREIRAAIERDRAPEGESSGSPL